jgi:hypothetical protein
MIKGFPGIGKGENASLPIKDLVAILNTTSLKV